MVSTKQAANLVEKPPKEFAEGLVAAWLVGISLQAFYQDTYAKRQLIPFSGFSETS